MTTRGLRLTSRQSEVLACIGRGLSYRQAGVELGIASSTVKAHVNTIALKLPNPTLLPAKTLVALHAPRAGTGTV